MFLSEIFQSFTLKIDSLHWMIIHVSCRIFVCVDFDTPIRHSGVARQIFHMILPLMTVLNTGQVN